MIDSYNEYDGLHYKTYLLNHLCSVDIHAHRHTHTDKSTKLGVSQYLGPELLSTKPTLELS